MLESITTFVLDEFKYPHYMVIMSSVLVLYLLTVRAMRYRTRDSYNNAEVDPNIPKVAHTISSNINLFEFPFVSNKSLEFGLFRTYGVPGISKLLAQTREMTVNGPKRYDDTNILILSFTENFYEHSDAVTALKRVNYLHSRYNIPNHEYLYTLSVFAFEPVRWIDKYEWRKLTAKEKQANFVYWREVGLRMNIKDIPDTYEEFEKFNIQYEKDHLVFSETNHKVAEATMDLFLSKVPSFMKGLLFKCACALMDEPLLKAMGLPRQSPFLEKFMYTLLIARGYFIRYLTLPRIFPVVRLGPLHRNQDQAKLKMCSKLDDDVHTLNFNVYDDTYPHGYQIRNLGPSCVFNNGKLGEIGACKKHT